MMQGILAESTPPNREYLELSFVGQTATGKGNNQIVTMEAQPDGSFLVTMARVGIRVGRDKPRKWVLPMEEWDSFYAQKIKRGYLLTKSRKMEKRSVTKGGAKEITDADVREIVQKLMEAAGKEMEKNYTVKVDDISDEMIAFGRGIVSELAAGQGHMSVAEFNTRLDQLFAAIPRRIDKLSKKHAQRQADFKQILADEAELLEFMIGQVRASGAENDAGKTILEQNGLTWRTVDAGEESFIKKMLADTASGYSRAWRVENARTAEAFDSFCRGKGLTPGNGITELFHGSKTRNFWSICVNGLLLNPDAEITGKMFGNGIYFAPKAAKSLGYTSRYGSYWASGAEECGYLAIYKVATGEVYDIYSENGGTPQDHAMLQKIHPGADCTWAKAKSGYLRNEEVIVYREDQCTIEYLVEIK